jgi:hypothetical protein
MREKLMAEIEPEEFEAIRLLRRIVLNDLEAFVKQERIDLDQPQDVGRLKEQFACDCLNAEMAIEFLARFCYVRLRLPDSSRKRFVSGGEPLAIDVDMTREEIVRRLEAVRPRNAFADAAFYAYRDLNRTEPEPFLLAAVERNPVSVGGARDLDDEAILRKIGSLPDESIYDEPGRLAQPDEVWNYGRGDGAEKALLLANLLRAREPDAEMSIEVTAGRAVLLTGRRTFEFASGKQLREQTWRIPRVVAVPAPGTGAG